jgi:hypothetical protein
MIAKLRIIRKIEWKAFLLIISVSAVIAYSYYERVDSPNYELREDLHKQIIQGTAPSPHRYRVLVPFTCNIFINILSLIFPKKLSFLFTYGVYDLFSICFTLIMLFLWLRKIGFTKEQSLIGVLFVGGTVPIALRDHWYQPWSLLEPGFFSLALILAVFYRDKIWLHFLLTALATLNRETAIFIPLLFLLTLDFKNSSIKQFLSLLFMFLIWAGIFFALRYFRGNAPHVETIIGLFSHNTQKVALIHTMINWVLFLGSFWIFVFLGYKRATKFILEFRQRLPNLTRGQVGDFSVIQSYLNGLCGGFCR